MIVWSVVAVGAVYEWAAAPLMLAAALLAALAPPETPGSPETRTLDRLLMASVLAAAVQLVPLPAALRGAGAIATWRPSSVSPAVTANAIGLVLAALIVFRTTRTYCARGLMPRVVGAVAFTGLFASLLALVPGQPFGPELSPLFVSLRRQFGQRPGLAGGGGRELLQGDGTRGRGCRLSSRARAWSASALFLSPLSRQTSPRCS